MLLSNSTLYENVWCRIANRHVRCVELYMHATWLKYSFSHLGVTVLTARRSKIQVLALTIPMVYRVLVDTIDLLHICKTIDLKGFSFTVSGSRRGEKGGGRNRRASPLNSDQLCVFLFWVFWGGGFFYRVFCIRMLQNRAQIA